MKNFRNQIGFFATTIRRIKTFYTCKINTADIYLLRTEQRVSFNLIGWAARYVVSKEKRKKMVSNIRFANVSNEKILCFSVSKLY